MSAVDRMRRRKAVGGGLPVAGDRQTSAEEGPGVSCSTAAAGEGRSRRAVRRPASSAAGGGADRLSTVTGENTI